jgi:hypothetical protein
MLKDFVPISHQRYQLAVEITKFVVGTAVVCEGADDVFAFTSAVPMTAPICQASDGLGGLLVHLKRVLGGKDKGSRFESILSSLPGNPSAEKTCLLVHERFTNLPLELICPLHSNLLEDLQWSAHSTIPECQAFQGIDSLLLLAPMAQSEGIPSGCMDVTGSSSIMYDRFDDEIFAQQAKQVLLLFSRHCPIIHHPSPISLSPWLPFSHSHSIHLITYTPSMYCNRWLFSTHPAPEALQAKHLQPCSSQSTVWLAPSRRSNRSHRALQCCEIRALL